MPDSIPKIIHQTWKTVDLPEEFARYATSVRAHHPGWDYRLWTDADNRALIARHYPWFLPTYDGYRHHIERVDAVRYFILLHYGGVYIDLDMECLQPADELFCHGEPSFSLLASPTVDDTIIANALMGTRPGHPFFAYLTQKLPRLARDDVTFADVFNTTGPDMLTRQIRLFESIFRFHIIGLDKVCDRRLIGDPRICGGRSIDAIRSAKLLHFIHHHANSWNIQRPPPPELEGYVLLEGHDIPGCDIEYVEYAEGDYAAIVTATDRLTEAVGFNYNGFIKGPGGRIARCSPDSGWMRSGMVPWICVKRAALRELLPSHSGQASQVGETDDSPTQ